MKQKSNDGAGLKAKLSHGVALLRVRAHSFFCGRHPAAWFAMLLALGLFAFLVRVAVCGGDAFIGIFHLKGKALLSDFFRSVMDAAVGQEVYSRRRVIYPPLANALFFLLSRAMPADFVNAPAALADQWVLYPAAVLCAVLFFALSLSLLVLVLARGVTYGVPRPLFGLLTAGSFPILFLLERGNLVILCLIALLVFVQNYESESAAAREVGLFALGVAVALKIYPVLFGLLLIRERRWRDAAHAATYAILLFLIPSLFFGGPFFCVKWLLKNTLYYSEYAGRGAIETLGAWGLSPLWARVAIYGAYVLALLFFVLFSLLAKKHFQIFALSAAVLLCIPSIFSAYNWVLFLPALFSFFKTERLVGANMVWFFAMATPFFVFAPKVYQDNGLIALIGVIIALSLFESIGLWRQRSKRKYARMG